MAKRPRQLNWDEYCRGSGRFPRRGFSAYLYTCGHDGDLPRLEHFSETIVTGFKLLLHKARILCPLNAAFKSESRSIYAIKTLSQSCVTRDS